MQITVTAEHADACLDRYEALIDRQAGELNNLLRRVGHAEFHRLTAPISDPSELYVEPKETRPLTTADRLPELGDELVLHGKPVRYTGRDDQPSLRYCGQCGQDYHHRACGPTHALFATLPYLSRADNGPLTVEVSL